MKKLKFLIILIFSIFLFNSSIAYATEGTTCPKSEVAVEVPVVLDSKNVTRGEMEISVPCSVRNYDRNNNYYWTGKLIVPINFDKKGVFNYSIKWENINLYPNYDYDVEYDEPISYSEAYIELYDNAECTGTYLDTICLNNMEEGRDQENSIISIEEKGTYYLKIEIEYYSYYNISEIPNEVKLTLSSYLFDVNSTRTIKEGEIMRGEGLGGSSYYYKFKIKEDGVVTIRCSPAFYGDVDTSQNNSRIILCDNKKNEVADIFFCDFWSKKAVSSKTKYYLKKGTYYIKTDNKKMKYSEEMYFDISYSFSKKNTGENTKKTAKTIKVDGTTYKGTLFVSPSKTIGNCYKFTLDKTTNLVFSYNYKLPVNPRFTFKGLQVAKTKDFLSYKKNMEWFVLNVVEGAVWDRELWISKGESDKYGICLPKGTYYIWIDNEDNALMNCKYSFSVKKVSEKTAKKYFKMNFFAKSYDDFLIYDKQYYPQLE